MPKALGQAKEKNEHVSLTVFVKATTINFPSTEIVKKLVEKVRFCQRSLPKGGPT